MSTENDVPLGEGSRRYYEEKFADRIRQVRKGGSAPRRGDTPPSYGRAGCGVAVAIFILIRILIAVLGTRSHNSSYNYSTPPRFNPGMQKQWDGIRVVPNKVRDREIDPQKR